MRRGHGGAAHPCPKAFGAVRITGDDHVAGCSDIHRVWSIVGEVGQFIVPFSCCHCNNVGQIIRRRIMRGDVVVYAFISCSGNKQHAGVFDCFLKSLTVATSSPGVAGESSAHRFGVV